MQVAFDPTITPPPQANPAGAANVRAPQVDPSRPHDRSKRDPRQDNASGKDKTQSFGKILSEETAKFDPSAIRGDTAGASKTEFIRAIKIPARTPASIEHDEGVNLFAERANTNRVAVSRETDPLFALGADIRAFAEASSQYAARFTAASSAFAVRGDRLEISA